MANRPQLTSANEQLLQGFIEHLTRQAKSPSTVLAYATRIQGLLVVHEQTSQALDAIVEGLPINATTIQTQSALRAWHRYLGTVSPSVPRTGWNLPSAAVVRLVLPRRVQWAAVHLHEWLRAGLTVPSRPGKPAAKRLLREIGVEASPWGALAWLSWEYLYIHDDAFDIVPFWRKTKMDDLWQPVLNTLWEYSGKPNVAQVARQWQHMGAEVRPTDALPLIGRRPGDNRGRYAFHNAQELRGLVETGGFRTTDPPPTDDEVASG